jgi:hypothetical protein
MEYISIAYQHESGALKRSYRFAQTLSKADHGLPSIPILDSRLQMRSLSFGKVNSSIIAPFWSTIAALISFSRRLSRLSRLLSPRSSLQAAVAHPGVALRPILQQLGMPFSQSHGCHDQLRPALVSLELLGGAYHKVRTDMKRQSNNNVRDGLAEETWVTRTMF